LGSFRYATFAQSFHWMDRERVAAIMFDMIEPGGALVHVNTMRGDGTRIGPDLLPALPYPSPPTDAVAALRVQYLGPDRRAGQGVLRHGTPGGEAEILGAAGFAGPRAALAPGGQVLERSIDDVIA